MKTRLALGALLIGTVAFAATATYASDTQVRFNIHLGIPVHAPVVVHHPTPHLYYPPTVVYYNHPGYHQGHHYGHHYRHHKHGKQYHPGSHWRHNDGYQNHAANSHWRQDDDDRHDR